MIHLSDWGSWVWWIIPESIIANLRLLFFRLFTDQWVFRLIPDLTLLLSVYMVFITRWQRESFRRQITFREGRRASARCAVILDTFHSGVGKQHGEMYGVLVGARRDGALSVSWHNHSEPQPCLRQLNQTALYLWSGWVDLIAIFIGSRPHKSNQWGRLYRRDHSSFASSLGNIVSGGRAAVIGGKSGAWSFSPPTQERGVKSSWKLMSLCPSVFTYPLDRVPSSGDNVSTFSLLSKKRKRKKKMFHVLWLGDTWRADAKCLHFSFLHVLTRWSFLTLPCPSTHLTRLTGPHWTSVHR